MQENGPDTKGKARDQGEDGATGAARPASGSREKLAILGQAVATVTHELRNPLASMRTWLHVLEQKLPPEDADLARPIDRIKRGIARCDAIIDDLLDFARARELSPEPTRIDPWLRALIDDQMPATDVAIEFHPGLGQRRFSIDRERMRRALINLIENAEQAIGSASEDGVVSIATQAVGTTLEIRVSDTGPGVPPELRAAIFEPLFSTKGAGIGLGLAVVTQVVAQHGGTVRYEDAPGGGACFIIAFPTGDAPPSA